MKPRIFIGSSVEQLSVAHLVQSNLDHDANCVVWDQGVFQLSSNALDDLIAALDNFDFAIMIFTPEDISIIREVKYQTVRDNIIFELGLFVGRLGKKHVFFVLPEHEISFHLPSDLSGIVPGSYNTKREDGNLRAALSPFCQQVRERIRNHIYENLNDLKEETDSVKKNCNQ